MLQLLWSYLAERSPGQSSPCTLQVRFIACQHPNSLVYVGGAPAHEQCDREGQPWVKMDPGFSIRHLIKPLQAILEQCAVPPQNLVRAALSGDSAVVAGVHVLRGGGWSKWDWDGGAEPLRDC